jgi:hypothetical protein
MVFMSRVQSALHTIVESNLNFPPPSFFLPRVLSILPTPLSPSSRVMYGMNVL